MATKFQVVVDATDPHAMCDFWAAVLHYDVEPQDSAFIRKMVDEGHAKESETIVINGHLKWRVGAAVIDPDGVGPRVLFQAVPEEKSVKNRVHLDLRIAADDRAAEVARLEALGARKLWDGQQGPSTWVTMADPEGNEFCVA